MPYHPDHQANPIPFAGKQYISYASGKKMLIPSKYAYANGSVAAITADGQTPEGITWAVNPLPDGTQKGSKGAGTHTEFPSPCPEDKNMTLTGAKWNGGLCCGERPFGVSVIDVLKIPEDVKPGDYVLGFRWDVEETAQVWSSCSDITIVAAEPAPTEYRCEKTTAGMQCVASTTPGKGGTLIFFFLALILNKKYLKK